MWHRLKWKIGNAASDDFLKACDEVFLTGTAVEITPVSCIENFNFEDRKLTKFLMSEFKKKVTT